MLIQRSHGRIDALVLILCALVLFATLLSRRTATFAELAETQIPQPPPSPPHLPLFDGVEDRPWCFLGCGLQFDFVFLTFPLFCVLFVGRGLCEPCWHAMQREEFVNKEREATIGCV